MAFINLRSIALVTLSGLTPLISALGQKQIISFESGPGSYQIAGGDVGTGQILVSSDDYWGVIRAAGDLALDFGRVTGTTYTLSNGVNGSEPASYTFAPVDVSNNTVYRVEAEQSFAGPNYTDPKPGSTVIIAGTVGHSKFINDLIAAQKLNTSEIDGQWESFASQLVENPIPGCSRALVIAGSDPRGTIYGIYDVSEQIGVSPWYFWADVPPKKATEIYVLPEGKVQGPPSVKYRGFFLNDEQPGLSSWVSSQWNDTWNGAAGYNHHFYSLVGELLLRLRANYLWPTVWGSMVYVDDPFNQPLLDAYEVVLGGSHTEPMMRAQNEFGTFYKGQWAYNLNNKTIDEYFRYGVQRAKPYSRNSLWTMAMRGTGDTAIEGNLGIEAIVEMLEVLVRNQQRIIVEGLGIESAAEVPSLWCLYKEVQSYQERGLHVPEDITLLWADDNWGNVRRLPLVNETSRSGGAGVYYHFDYVGGPRDYKWINTIQLEKTAEQMSLAYARDARRIWIVNVGDLKPLEIPISHFFDLAYDVEKWGGDGTGDWLNSWATREFGDSHSSEITEILTKYGMYAARRKFELVQPQTYSVINYNEADAVLEQWAALHKQAQAVYDALDEEYRAAFFEMILHPITGGEILHKIQINGAKNQLYAGQKRNLANDVIDESRGLLDADAELTNRWNELLDGKWVHMLDQTHLGYDDYWQQPTRNTLPDMRYVQTQFPSLGGQLGVGVEASNASVQGDDRWHPNSSNDLTVPPLDPYGALTRYFEVFTRGNKECPWEASPSQPWVKLSQYKGTVGGENGTDSRVLISIDWEKAPMAPNTTLVPINVTAGCVGKEKYAGSGQRVIVPVVNRKVPSNFTEGFVESDGHVSIEGPHYQKIIEPSSSSNSSSSKKLKYHVLKNYGRTLGGVTLYPPESEKAKLGEGPALEYNMYLFSNTSKATVKLYISPSGNYLGDGNPLEYGISLYPTGGAQPQPKTVQPVGKTQGQNMPPGWDGAVADAVWGLSGNYTTTTFNVTQEGAYTLRVWALLPNIIVQKIVVDLGGVRTSYLGPPESFLMGRDEQGAAQRTAFTDTPGILGGRSE
ncbi:immunoglobulin I-set domain-containing protein [Colletotrichum eremochloae]|nr:immunoglobulin I-set domain-containing protein [Colletotrichum eremochloae]